MDNKNHARPAKASQPDSSRKSTTDIQSSKPWPRNSHRREQPSAPRPDSQRNSKQNPTSGKARPNVDKRPRPRGGGNGGGAGFYRGTSCVPDDISAAGSGLAFADAAYGASGAVAKTAHLDYELNSVYAPGSKKQNLNHLLNFHYAPRESDYSMGMNVFGRSGGGGSAGGGMHRHNGGAGGKKHKYNKEQFLQANFQFVIKSSAKPKLTASPDTLIDWSAIEQINIQTTEEPQCPICLYPPIAAKLTRCGHAYCWPCILHYLALSDKTWRKCPICYEAIHTADLKSTTIMQQRQINVDADITFQLMRRKKGSMFIEKFKSCSSSVERYPQVSRNNDEARLFSKFLIARRGDILDIVERERRELITDEDASCPEFVFIQQALDLLKERRDKLGDIEFVDIKEEEDEGEGEDDAKPFKAAENDPVTATAPEVMAEEIPSTLDDLVETTNEAIAAAATTKYYYFYQSEDGQNIYLHPLNVKMLQACYGSLDRAPLIIQARIIQKEYHSMDEEHRRKFTCMGHLPLTCQFAVVEVDLQPPIVTGGILKLFKDDILHRKKERQRREREERKREKQIDEINDRQMGKLIASTVNLNLTSSHEFPTCGFEESLLGADSLLDIDAVPATNRSSSYSVAVAGQSTKREYWPTLASPTTTTNNSYQELSIWGKTTNNTSSINRGGAAATASERSSECESINEAANDSDIAVEFLPPMRTRLSDVLAEAISQKQQHGSGGLQTGVNKKKNKKSKKMLPLFSTGMNYNGN